MSRALVVAEVGFWASSHPHLQDVQNYETWARFITSAGEFPGGGAWQYPPAAGLLMLLPRLAAIPYGEAFVGMMLLCDLAGLVLLARLAKRSGDDTGVWVWLLAMPFLGTFAVLRFDLVPTVIAIGALVVIHRRPGWFGALAGLGASIKIWPLLLPFGEWSRPRLLRALAAAVAVSAVIAIVSALVLGNATGFLANARGRGLQEESVAAVPWQLEQIVTGNPYPRQVRDGAWEISTSRAQSVAALLRWLTLLGLAVACVWWQLRARAIRAGRTDLADPAVSRAFVLTLTLFVTTTSPVLSSQYMVWLLGLAAVVLCSEGALLRRPAWIVVGATLISSATFRSPQLITLRDLALLFATVDAAAAMARALREVEAPAPA